MIVDQVAVTDFWTDAGTCTTTPQQLKTDSFPLRKGIVLRANSGNSQAICVGNSDAKNTGYILAPGERTPLLQVDNLNKLFVVASADSQGYSWFAC
jgi:hypothetical protein